MKTISVRFGYMVAVLGIAGLVQVAHAPISAAAPNPDSCFTTTGTTSRTITDYNVAGVGCGATVEIPSTISGGTVTSIGDFAFYNKGLTSVTIPNSITSIGVGAFQTNQLTSVTIPNSVTSIEEQVFLENQLTLVTIPNSVTSIGYRAFAQNQLTSVTIPNSVTSIGSWAFELNQLTSLIIPNSVTVIEQGAFSSNQLVSVTIPNSLTSIERLVFDANQLTSVTIPSSVTSIGNYAFSGNRLVSVTIPSSVTSIGNSAFSFQNPVGSNIFPLLSSSNVTTAQAAVDSIWYVRLYTADPSNPQGFIDGIWFGQTELDGQDNDRNEPYNAGGHLVNPTSAELQFVDGSNGQLLSPVLLTGQTTDGTIHFNDYLASNGPAVALPVDTYNPTLLELQAARTALSQYYRAGDTLSYTASPINGVTPTPSSYSFVLGASTASNQRQFVYAAAVSNSPAQATGQLANTGLSLWMIGAVAGVLIIGSLGVIGKRL